MADGVEDFLFVITTQKLMDGGEVFGDGLLQDSQRNCYSLQVLCTCDDVDVDRSESAIVDDGSLMGLTDKVLGFQG